jgi:hypothetical protein
MDAIKVKTLNMSAGSNAERAWLLDAVELLLRIELERKGKDF